MAEENENPTTPDEDEAAFDDAFAEFAEGPADDDKGGEDDKDDDKAGDDKDDDKAGDDKGGEDDKAGDDDDAKAGDDKAGEAAKPDDEKDSQSSEKKLDKDDKIGDSENTDDVSTLRSELEKAKHERDVYKHKHSSDAGRNRAYQKRVEELQQQLDSANKIIDEATNASPDELEALKEKHPHLAALIERQGEKVSRKLQAENEALKARLDQVANKIESQDEAETQDAIGKAHKDWKVVIKTDQFKQWLEKQDDTVQGWYYESSDPSDAIAALDLYRIEHPVEAPPAEPDDEAKKAEEAKKLAEQQKRDQQLKGAAAVPNSSGAPRDIPEIDDFDASFDHFTARKQKENAT